MKNILTIFAFFLSLSLNAQKYIQDFVRMDGNPIAISLSYISFVLPSGIDNGSVIVLGPNPKTIYVTDSIQAVVDSSASMLVLLEEVYTIGAGTFYRDVAVSKLHVKEIVPEGDTLTRLRMASPQKSILINSPFATVAAALSAESGGGGGVDGNGIYSGSGRIRDTVNAIMDPNIDTYTFRLGDFDTTATAHSVNPGTNGIVLARNNASGYRTQLVAASDYDARLSWIGLDIPAQDTTELYPPTVRLEASDQDGVVYNSGLVTLTDNMFYASIDGNGDVYEFYFDKPGNNGFIFTEDYVEFLNFKPTIIKFGAVEYRYGSGSPEGVVAAPVGSIYTNTAGGVSTTLYVKTSGAGNTGWTAK